MRSLLVLAITLLFSSILFSHSAYTASYVNVSSGGGNSGTSAEETVSPGIVNLGSIKPSSTGTMATGNDTLTIHTDCSAGYKVYVSGQNGKSTNLINSNAEDPTSPTNTELISSASNLPTASTSASNLNNNTWGINGNATDISSHLYYGLPPYSDATAYPLVTKADVPEESTVPIYYGVKVNTDITPGTYTGDVLYTVIMDTTCLAYTVVFNPNVDSSSSSEISGTMNNQSITYNKTTELSQNAYTRSGYGFLGWSTSSSGKTGNAVHGIGTLDDVEYSDLQEVNNLTTGGSTITLYAIWIKVDGNMQSWNGCSSLATNSIVRLIDTRDNKVYAIKKTPDGKCWMLQNLTANHITMTPQDTNISDGRTYYLPKKNTRYPIAGPFNASNTTINSDILNASDSVDFSTTNSNQVQVGYRAQGTTDNNTGNAVPENTAYYNFYTASLGYSYYNDDKTSSSSPQDICPKGWHLPWSSDNGSNNNSSAEFYVLAKSYNPSISWSSSTSGPNTGNSTILNNMIAGRTNSLDRFSDANGAAGFTFTGNYEDTALNRVGTYALYQTSSISNFATNNFRLYGTTNSIYPQDGGSKYHGYPVRCLVDNYTIHFDANGGTGTMDNQVVFGNNSSTQTIKSNTFTKTGYHFLGWSTNSSATSATYTNGQSVSGLTESGKTIKLYAVWTKANYNLTVSNGSTTAVSSIQVNSTTKSSGTATSIAYDTSTTVRCVPKSGYHCTDWTSSNTTLLPSKTGNTSTGNYDYSFNMPAGNVTLTASGAANTFTVYYNSNGGSGSTSSQTATYGTNISLRSNSFTAPSGKMFKFWSTSSSGGTTYSAGQSVSPATLKSNITTTNGGSITLYAIWETNNPIELNNASCSSTVGVTTGPYKLNSSSSTATIYTIRLKDGKCWTKTPVGGGTYSSATAKCPSNWSIPSGAVYGNLVKAYGGVAATNTQWVTLNGYRENTGALQAATGWTPNVMYWSADAPSYNLNVYTNSSDNLNYTFKTGGHISTSGNLALCVRS